MQIISTNNLTGKQRKSIEKLLKKVHSFDQTYRDPYLASDYNFDKDMPASFLTYNQSDELIGTGNIC